MSAPKIARETDPSPARRTILITLGIAAVFFTAILACRILWEETSLTWDQGPQMIGFSLAHGYGAILFLAPVAFLVWLIVALIIMAVSLFRRRRLSRPFWTTLGTALVLFGLMSIPAVFWQWLFVATFAKSPHAADLLTYAAGEGDLRTVQRYLQAGVPLEGKDYQGSTSTFNAAAAGRTDLVLMLSNKGANLNATNDYGDSPLEAAVENHHDDVAAFLRSHGAQRIHGTAEQRDAASKAIVDRDIQRMEKETAPSSPR